MMAKIAVITENVVSAENAINANNAQSATNGKVANILRCTKNSKKSLKAKNAGCTHNAKVK